VAVIFHEQVAVAGIDELDVEALAGGVELGLFQAMGRGQIGGLGLYEGHGEGLRVGVDSHPQGVVHPALGLLPGLALDDLNGAGGFFPADEVLGPPPAMKGGINQLGPGICLAQAHAVLPP